MVAPPISRLATFRLSAAAKSAGTFSTKSAGTVAISKPSKSLTWLVAMMIAMPIVKPLITGSGT